ncbi:MAG TPA: M48 family metallopeptidase [Anaerolineales bacterium]|nr:M48 family metallopeptidase [Anaerolineales bacterium]
MEAGTIDGSVKLDPERQTRAKQYSRINRRLMLVDMIVSGLYMLAWLVFGWSKELKEWLLSFTSNPWLLLPAYLLVIGGILFLINLPLSYYQGFILPHRFELSTQNLKGWIIDQVKGILLGGVFGLIVLEIIYAVLRATPELWWLWAALILLIFNVILVNLAPVILMPLFNKYVPLGEEHADLAGRLMDLAQRSGTYVRGVFKFDMSRRTKQANAGLTGLGNTRRIVIGDTLLNEFTPDEIETVMAHELGHQVNKDIPLGIVFGSLTTLVGLYLASVGLEWGVKTLGYTGAADIAAFPLLLIVLGLYGLVTMPIENGFSRWREHKADVYALQLTHKGQAFASALRRLANQNLSDADPEAWVEWLLYSHPALGKRIALAERGRIQPTGELLDDLTKMNTKLNN